MYIFAITVKGKALKKQAKILERHNWSTYFVLHTGALELFPAPVLQTWIKIFYLCNIFNCPSKKKKNYIVSQQLCPKKHWLLSALQTHWWCDLQARCNLFHRGFYYCVKAREKQNCCASHPALAPFPTFQGTYSFSLMQHLFDVAVLQSTHTLPPVLFRGFLKITSGESFIASRQGKQGSTGKLAGCVFCRTMREC